MIAHTGSKALEGGSCVALFPEGISRYHPEVAPLKTGGKRREGNSVGLL